MMPATITYTRPVIMSAPPTAEGPWSAITSEMGVMNANDDPR